MNTHVMALVLNVVHHRGQSSVAVDLTDTAKGEARDLDALIACWLRNDGVREPLGRHFLGRDRKGRIALR